MMVLTRPEGAEMAREEVIEDPILRHRLGFRRGLDADGGEVLHVDIRIAPGGGVTPHVHPRVEERFTVVSGSPSFLSGRTWRTASPGETVLVPPGVRHAYRNRGSEVAHVVCDARPAGSLQEFLEDVAALSRSGGLSRHKLPTRPRAVLRAAVLAHRPRDTVVLLFPPMPPPFVQRLLFPILARLGERTSAFAVAR